MNNVEEFFGSLILGSKWIIDGEEQIYTLERYTNKHHTSFSGKESGDFEKCFYVKESPYQEEVKIVINEKGEAEIYHIEEFGCESIGSYTKRKLYRTLSKVK